MVSRSTNIFIRSWYDSGMLTVSRMATVIGAALVGTLRYGDLSA